MNLPPSKKSKSGKRVSFRLSSYDQAKLDKATADISDTVRSGGARISGPFPLPSLSRRLCLNRSPHIYGKAKDHFKKIIHRRLLSITDFASVAAQLQTLGLPSGVYVENVSEKKERKES